MKRYKYVGKERDEETGLYYYGARYYSAWLGRFVSVDPLNEKYPELSSYQYASNRPITGIDLDGLEFVEPSKALLFLGKYGVNWNSNNISKPLYHAISEKKYTRESKFEPFEWKGEIGLNIQISSFDSKNYNNKYQTTLFDDVGYVNENSQTYNPKVYNSTPIAKSTGEFDKRYNPRYSPVWWRNTAKGGKMGAIIDLTVETLNLSFYAYSNYKINEDIEVAIKQTDLLDKSITEYNFAEEIGFIPEEITTSPNYLATKTSIINSIFSGESHNTNGSLNFTNSKGESKIISGDNYQKMISDIGSKLFELSNKGFNYSNYQQFDITSYIDSNNEK